jgi:hypothetical protein
MKALPLLNLHHGRWGSAWRSASGAIALALFLGRLPSGSAENSQDGGHAKAEPLAPASKATQAPAPAAVDKPETEPEHQESLSPATKQDELSSPNILAGPKKLTVAEKVKDYQERIESARRLRREKNTELGGKILTSLLADKEMPAEFRRPALFELALTAQEENKLPRAQQILSQYVHLFPEDPSVPEVLLRQGLIYRQMGVNNLAVAKYYAVMSTALKLKLDQFDYYKRLVLQAQTRLPTPSICRGNMRRPPISSRGSSGRTPSS